MRWWFVKALEVVLLESIQAQGGGGGRMTGLICSGAYEERERGYGCISAAMTTLFNNH